ncbi:NHP2 protein, partial [Polypterus senegalus]|nr:NHP2 protein [Polypterus senegalus]
MTKSKKEKATMEEEEEAAAAAGGNEKTYQELIANVNAIAQPLASRKLSKKLYKCIKKGSEVTQTCGRKRPPGKPLGQGGPSVRFRRPLDGCEDLGVGLVCQVRLASSFTASKMKQIRRGVKEVQKFINKGEKGIVVLAGDTLPIDVYCHIPVLCEDKSIPYVYIPSKVDLGSSAGSKRPTCVLMIKQHDDYQDAYEQCLEEVSCLPTPV